MSDLRPIEIFRPGRHTAMSGAVIEFTEPDLEAAASAYDPATHEAPLVVGHPRHDAPAYGWVSNLAYADGSLQATPGQVDESFSEMVRNGRFKKVSASFYTPDSPANPKPGAYYLRHVGFLGAQPPAVKGLKQAEFADSPEGVVELEFGEDATDDALWARFKRWLSIQTARDPDFSGAHTNGPAYSEPAGGNQPAPSHEDDMTQEELEAREAKIAEREKKLEDERAAFAEREKQIAEAEARARRAEYAEFADKVIDEGRILPRDRDGLIAFMDSLDSDTVVSFGEGSEAVKKPARDWFKSFVESLPVTVDYAERGHRAHDGEGSAQPSNAAPGMAADPDKERLRRRALDYAEKNNVDFVTAVTRLQQEAE